MNEAALQQLLDKQAILELVNTYCRAADRHDHALMRTLYHEDATDDHGSFFKGLAMEFIDKLPAIQAPMAILHHNVTTVNIRFNPDNPCQAEGEVYLIAFHQIKTEQGLMDLLIGGRYLDRYEKRQNQWKFSHRAVLADWANLHNPTIVNLDNPIIAGAHIGKPGEADPSYQVLNLFGRGQ